MLIVSRNANLNDLVIVDDIMQATMMEAFEEGEGQQDKKGETKSSTPVIPSASAPSGETESPLVTSSMISPPRMPDRVISTQQTRPKWKRGSQTPTHVVYAPSPTAPSSSPETPLAFVVILDAQAPPYLHPMEPYGPIGHLFSRGARPLDFPI